MAITRAEVLRRAATIWTPGTVPYSMTTNHQPDGYRQDCSGYVSLCWAVPAPGGSTVTMAPPDPRAVMHAIDDDELKPGDAIGKCGPGTGGAAGHIQLFEGWDSDGTGLWIWEQAGGTVGQRRRKVKTVGQGEGYTAWRFREISDGGGPTPPVGGKAAVTGMIGVQDPEGGQFTVGMSEWSQTGYYWTPIGSGERSIALQAGGVSIVENTRPAIFGPSAAAVREQAIIDIAARVVATLPPGQGGGGPTLAQIAAAVRAELDRTGLASVPGLLAATD